MALESPIARDGDMGFIGYASRMNPVTLPPGVLQLSENMRLDRGVAVTRKGAKRLVDNISPGVTPLTIPFVLNDPVILSVYSGGIFASAVMRSQDHVGSMEIVVLAGPEKGYTYLTDGSVIGSETWSDGALAVDGVDNLETEDGQEIAITLLPTELPFPINPAEIIEETDKVSMIQAYDRLYLFREADSRQPGYGTQYTNSSGITVSGTTATVNITGHGYPEGARVRIDGSQVSAAFDGQEFDIKDTNLNTDSFEITVPSGTTPDASAGLKIRRVKPPLYWSGDPATSFVRATAGIPDVGVSYRRLHSVPWGSYINNRLIVPDGRQNIMLSDVLDPDVFDPFFQSFRINVGGNDRVVAVHPWIEGSLLVFCRKSIWLAQLNQFSSTDGTAFAVDTPITNLVLLTDEIGCAARKTIATAGQFIYFLSDSGVYRLDARLDLKLRGNTKPLSDPISNQISNLNNSLVGNAVALYFDNRYYLAVPLAGANNNNGVFIYNQLNEQWETRDVYGFGVGDFVVSDVADQRRLLISNRAGKLMLLDEIEAGDDSPDAEANVVSPVPGRIITRRYGFNSMHNKRFIRSLADVVLPDSASITVQANTYNPDAEIVLVPGQTNDSGLSEDYTLKNPIRRKAHYAELEFLTTANRPEIRNVSVEAALASRPQTETRHAA